MQTIKLNIILILCIYLSPLQSSNFKGSRGEYYIQGVAYNKFRIPIRNKTFNLFYNRTNEKITTNSKGEFEVMIKWKYPCLEVVIFEGRDTFPNAEEKIKIMNTANSDTLTFTYKNKTALTPNVYKKYTHRFSYTKADMTHHVNMRFK
jgi:hypothetical protein